MTVKTRKIPMRMCVGCREKFPKKELTRVVRAQDGRVFIDSTGKAAGRGAYICANAECLKKAVKSKMLERALEQELGEDVTASLEEMLKG